ncbi:uncharacterized protein LOC107024968 [Solanum pennellii]|uniref:Uncharacterized protein LOC107024968 n=1 Tax=Solanum pennellii TaxID=28526 RepID=A0ABM1H787_SOLPN|nr:uncharacterized protein LOC107024968 [Solanum pennellii]
MYLEGDVLDHLSWINREQTLLYWEELVKALQENYGMQSFKIRTSCRCKTASLTLMEANDNIEGGKPREQMSSDIIDRHAGHVISKKGVGVDRDKVQAVLEWPVPINLKKLRGFLKLTGYYRRFLKGYRMMARPLTELTKKNDFQWSNSVENAFQLLKKALIIVLILQIPDLTQPFVVEV